jgi:diguanylate cyclase (GGDEF)-like protein
MRERTWRLDPIETGLGSGDMNEVCEPEYELTEGGRTAAEGPPRRVKGLAVGSIRRWDQTVRSWVRARLGGFADRSDQFENVIHEFAAIIAVAENPAFVEAALVRITKLITPASRVELIPRCPPSGEGGCEDHFGPGMSDRGGNLTTMETVQDRDGVIEIELRFGGELNGRLRVRSRPHGKLLLSKPTIRQLSTVCTMAACALENLSRRMDSHWEEEPANTGNLVNTEPAFNGVKASSNRSPSTPLQDATFLNAVLPFALSQARRHREPLSLLCVTIDRLSGIQELLGRPTVERLVRHMGETVASLIRASDIVARLDDDRVVVVLPRAPAEGALHVARKICCTFAEKSQSDPVLPGVTVSIGVAAFPACADNVYSLFNAADNALAKAQSQGRNRSMLASPQTVLGQGERATTASPS